MRFNFFSKVTYRNVFVVSAILLGFTMTFLSFDYGPLEDTKIHQDHGVRILNYFKGIDKIAALSPVNEAGKYINVALSQDHENRGMNGFGGFFDLLTNFLHQFFDSIDVYVLKNFLNSIFGFFLFLFCGLLGKELGGWKVGLLTLLFVVLTPVMFGYSMNNPKDIPAAAFYMFSLYHIVKLLKELPKFTLKRSFYLVFNISLLINIRVIGLMVIGYVLLAVLLWWLLENYKSKFKNIIVKDTSLLAVKAIGVSVIAYLATSIFWPYAHTNPITVPIEVLFKMGEMRTFENLQLFEGNWQSSYNAPWYFAIKNLFIITMPLHAFIGFFLIPLLYYKNKDADILDVSLVLFTSVFPMLLVILAKPNSHDGSRHFMFAILPMVVLSALAWCKLFQLISKKNLLKTAYIILGLLLIQPLKFMIQYHPMQALYFSPIIGGVSGAFGNYEIDYYGVAVRPALDWLEENVADQENPPRVRLYYGSQAKLSSYLDKSNGLKHVLCRRDSDSWDYSIIMLAEGKYKRDHVNVNWSLENTVHELKIDGVAVCFIVKNNYQTKDQIPKLRKEVELKPTVNGYIRLSLLYYKKFDYFNSIQMSNKAIAIDSQNSIIYNNLCSAYNSLKMYDKAKEACEKSLMIDNNSERTKNNLAASMTGIIKMDNGELNVEEYVSLSYYYYKFGFYRRCISVSEYILQQDPNSTTAYNNICSSYNVLGEFEKAIVACNEALKIDPEFERAKNNLNWAKKELGKN